VSFSHFLLLSVPFSFPLFLFLFLSLVFLFSLSCLSLLISLSLLPESVQYHSAVLLGVRLLVPLLENEVAALADATVKALALLTFEGEEIDR
jgi:hypothetical protein